MARITFTNNLDRLIECPPQTIEAATVAQALDEVFAGNRRLAGYILDDQNRLRRHVAIFVDGRLVKDRIHLTDPVGPDSELHVMQALSGG